MDHLQKQEGTQHFFKKWFPYDKSIFSQFLLLRLALLCCPPPLLTNLNFPIFTLLEFACLHPKICFQGWSIISLPATRSKCVVLSPFSKAALAHHVSHYCRSDHPARLACALRGCLTPGSPSLPLSSCHSYAMLSFQASCHSCDHAHSNSPL